MANTKGTITIAVRLRRLIPFAVAHAVMDGRPCFFRC